jgi:hypothetical protein
VALIAPRCPDAVPLLPDVAKERAYIRRFIVLKKP